MNKRLFILVPFLSIWSISAIAVTTIPSGTSEVTLNIAYPGENTFILPIENSITSDLYGITGDSSQNWNITIYGPIDSGNAGSASGIRLGGIDNGAANIINFGTISSASITQNGPSGIQFTNGGQIFNGINAIIQGPDGIHTDGGILTLLNHGIIRGTTSGGTAAYSGAGAIITNYEGGQIIGDNFGISLNTPPSSNGVILNYGLIHGDSRGINLSGGNVYSIYNASTGIIEGGARAIIMNGIQGYLLNEGLITANDTAITSDNSATENRYINAGIITSQIGYGIQTTSSDTNNHIYNLGVISGATTAIRIEGSGTNLYLGQSAYLPQLDRIITGSGSVINGNVQSLGADNIIHLTDNGLEDSVFSGFDSLFMNGNQWRLTSDIILNESLVVQNGVLSMPSDITIASGDFIVNNTGTFIFEGTLDTGTSTLSMPIITVMNATIDGELQARVTNLTDIYQGPAVLTTVLSASNSLTLAQEQWSREKLFYGYDIFRSTGNPTELTLRIRATAAKFADFALSPNSKSLAGSLDTAMPIGIMATTGELRTALTDLFDSDAKGEAIMRLQELSPAVLAGTLIISPRVAQHFDHNIYQHIVGLDDRVWLDFYGDWDKQKNNSTDPGYNGTHFGATAGAIANFRNIRLGTAVLFENSILEWDNDFGKTESKSIAGDIFVSFESPTWFLMSDVMFGATNAKTDRNIITQKLTASSDYWNYWAGVGSSLGYRIDYGGWHIVPMIGANFYQFLNPTVIENGAGTAGQTMDKHDWQSLEVISRFDISRRYYVGFGSWRPRAFVGVSVETLDSVITPTVSFTGTPSIPYFNGYGPDAGRTALDIGIGFDLFFAKFANFYIEYNGSFRENYTDHMGRFGWKISF